MDLKTIQDIDDIASGWNGKDDQFNVGGVLYREEHATVAVEIMTLIKELEEL